MTPAPASPPPLEDLINAHVHRSAGEAASLVESVRRLGRMFNGLDPLDPCYMDNRELRRAYITYYLPVNEAKVGRVLDELARLSATVAAPIRVLDIGSGPGTAALAVARRRKIESLHLVDRSQAALDEARILLGRLGVSATASRTIPTEGMFDLILAANVINEMRGPGDTLDLRDRLEPGGFLVALEPATAAATRGLTDWRDRMVAAGWTVTAPCLCSTAACPMVGRVDLWCHQAIPWDRPSWVAQVDRRLGLDKEELKFSYVVLTRGGATHQGAPGSVRLVSNLHSDRTGSWAWACDRQGRLTRAALARRDRGDDTLGFTRARRGDVLDLDLDTESGRVRGPVFRRDRM